MCHKLLCVPVYIYPKLGKFDLGFVRFRGMGLANSFFILARSFLLAKKLNAKLINPTWFQMSFYQWFHGERDKRTYCGLFNSVPGSINGWRKTLLFLASYRFVPERGTNDYPDHVIVEVQKCAPFFDALYEHRTEVSKFILSLIKPKILRPLNGVVFSDSIAVHVRRGDFGMNSQVPISWYVKILSAFQNYANRAGLKFNYIVFSDGTDKELAPILKLPNTKRVFFGNALADIVAMSRCAMLVGGRSTFSAWGIFLGNLPYIFFEPF